MRSDTTDLRYPIGRYAPAALNINVAFVAADNDDGTHWTFTARSEACRHR